jgi:hypothetical protein
LLVFSIAVSVAGLIGIISIGVNASRFVNVLQSSLLVGAAVGFMVSVGTTRVAATADNIRKVHLWHTVPIPWSQVQSFVVQNGFQVRLVSGREIESSAFGSSLIDAATGNRRAKRLAADIDSRAFRSAVADPGPGWEQDSVDAELRVVSLILPAACALGAVALASVLLPPDRNRCGSRPR